MIGISTDSRIKSSRPALLPKEFQATLGDFVFKAITIGTETTIKGWQERK